MAPFFGSSFLYTPSRRRLTEMLERTPPPCPPTTHSTSLPNLEELRGLSASFIEEFSPLLQSSIGVTTKSRVLSTEHTYVSVFAPGGSDTAWSMSSSINRALAQGSTPTVLEPVTLTRTEEAASRSLSDHGSVTTICLAKRATQMIPGAPSVEISNARAVQQMKQEIEEVEAGFRESSKPGEPGKIFILPSVIPLKIDCYDHKRLINDLKKNLHAEREAYWTLCFREQSLSNDCRALEMENQRLKDALASSSEFKLLQKLENEISAIRQSISRIITTDMDVPALRAASHVLKKGANADNALTLALKVAVNNAKDDSPWATITSPDAGEHSHEEYLAITQRNAELGDEVHLLDKKYRLWKIKAQMDPKYAGFISPSPSSTSFLLDALAQEQKLDLEHVNHIFEKFHAGEGFTVCAAISPVPYAGPSESQTLEITMTASSVPEVLASSLKDVADETKYLEPSATLSPSISGGPDRSPALSDAYTDCAGKNSLSPIRRYIPGFKLFGGNGLGIAPQALFDSISDSENSEDEADSIFSSDSSESQSVTSLARAIRDLNEVIEELDAKFPESPGLEYIDEHPGDGCFNAVLLENDDSSNKDGSSKRVELQSSPPILTNAGEEREDNYTSPVLRTAIAKGSESLEDLHRAWCQDVEGYPSDGMRNPVLRDGGDISTENSPMGGPLSEHENIDDYPTDGRRNPVLRDTDDSSSEDAPLVITLPRQEDIPLAEPTENNATTQPSRERSLLSTIVQSASSSISSLKRISSAGSSIKQSISTGLKRLRQISLKSRQKDSSDPGTSQLPASSQRQSASSSGRENKPPQFKAGNTSSNNPPRSRIPAPTTGIRRPTIASTLKGAGVNAIQPTDPTASRFPKGGKTKHQANPIPVAHKQPASRRAPLVDITAQPPTQKAPESSRRKAFSKGRQVIERIGRFIP